MYKHGDGVPYAKQLHKRNVTCACDFSAKEGEQRLEDLRAGWAANIAKSQEAPGSVKGLFLSRG